MQKGQSASLSGGLASMGAAVPYAVGAKFAYPDRPVIALVGDGAMQMNNLAELITVQKYWKRWKGPRWIVCVFNNQDLNEVTWEQRVMEGNPEIQRFPGHSQLRVRQLRRDSRIQGHLCELSRSSILRLAGGPFLRSARRDRGQDGS